MINNFAEELNKIYISSGLDSSVINLADDVMNSIKPIFSQIDKTKEINQMRVLLALQEARLSDSHFSGSTGYGYDDSGREKIEQAFANIFGGEKAFVRCQISSGTQAIAMALFGILRPNDILLSVTGKPYDTLMETIGTTSNSNMGSLKDFGINYEQVDFDSDGEINYTEIRKMLKPKTKIVFIQKSKGYTSRRALCISDIEKIVKTVRESGSDAIILVDNCYGEFVETQEPCHVGADICAGSLIKNPGGGICKTGGYLVGKENLIEMAASRLTAPGVGSHIGPTLGFNQMIAQGIFLAPHIVSEALKGAVFSAELFERAGFKSNPKSTEKRGDIVQTLTFDDETKLVKFCQSIQAASPVDSFVSPQPWDMPGYDEKVIMAAGAFVQGSSIELSCDAPIKSPYIAFMQGGLVFEHVKYAVMKAISTMQNK